MTRYRFTPETGSVEVPSQAFKECSAAERQGTLDGFDDFDVYLPGNPHSVRDTHERERIARALRDDATPVAMVDVFPADPQPLLSRQGVVVLGEAHGRVYAFLSSLSKDASPLAILVPR